MSNRFVVVYEGQPDFITATELADRVLVHEIDWLDETLLDTQRQWWGSDPTGRPLQWTSVAKNALKAGIGAHGHFDGKPGMPDARAVRRAILYVLNRFESVDAVLLIRDMDDQDERRNGLEQARISSSLANRVVIGVAIPERESWVICGFDTEDDDERRRFDSESQKLGAKPNLRSHELTACKNDQALRSPKRVLAALTDGDWVRQRRCWRTTELDVLKDRGQNNGLMDYLNEIKKYLVPLVTGHDRHS